MNKLILIIFTIAVVAQLTGIVLLFIDAKLALQAFIYYVATIILLVPLLIIKKRKTKEEDPNDYRDY
ncbi:hypothetical protein [Priestia sp. GS2]|uniref:hypothetical protein n=1 Tax=Priestia sp. GS2 TaxID=3117403 RepID=UPI002EDA3101